LKEIEFYLDVDKGALTEERVEEYKQQYDEEGYLITGDMQVDEIYVDTIGSPTITIRAYNDEVYTSACTSRSEYSSSNSLSAMIS
jgi:hypothetical protein